MNQLKPTRVIKTQQMTVAKTPAQPFFSVAKQLSAHSRAQPLALGANRVFSNKAEGGQLAPH